MWVTKEWKRSYYTQEDNERPLYGCNTCYTETWVKWESDMESKTKINEATIGLACTNHINVFYIM